MLKTKTKPEPSHSYERDEMSWSKIQNKPVNLVRTRLEDHIRKSVGAASNELLQIVNLDAEMRIIQSTVISPPHGGYINIDIRSIVEVSLYPGTSGIILAHNASTNTIQPSSDQIAGMQALDHLLSLLGIDLLEHFVLLPNKTIIGISNFIFGLAK